MSKRGSRSAVFIGEVKAFERKPRKKSKKQKQISVKPLPGLQPIIKLKNKCILEKFTLTELQQYYYDLMYSYEKLMLCHLVKINTSELFHKNDKVLLS